MTKFKEIVVWKEDVRIFFRKSKGPKWKWYAVLHDELGMPVKFYYTSDLPKFGLYGPDPPKTSFYGSTKVTAVARLKNEARRFGLTLGDLPVREDK